MAPHQQRARTPPPQLETACAASADHRSFADPASALPAAAAPASPLAAAKERWFPGAVSQLAVTKPEVALPSGVTIPADRVYVCKMIVREPSAQSGRDVLDEVNVISTCAHPCIVAFIECYEEVIDIGGTRRPTIHLITEFVDGGDLAHHVKQRAFVRDFFSENKAVFLFVQIALAVEYLHRHNILHLDLKSANVREHRRSCSRPGLHRA